MHRFETNNTTYLIKDEDLSDEMNINEPFWGNDWTFTEHKGPYVHAREHNGSVVHDPPRALVNKRFVYKGV